MEYPALKRAAASLYEAWRPQAVLIEDKGSGQRAAFDSGAATGCGDGEDKSQNPSDTHRHQGHQQGGQIDRRIQPV